MADGARASVGHHQQGTTRAAPAKLRVFISYSREDLAFADQLVVGLELTGFEPTLDRHGISGGEAWERRLGALIREADTVVFVMSPASAASKVCAWEVGEAARLNKRIIPLLCQPLAEVSPPPQLRELNYIFFYAEPTVPGSGFGSGLARLVAALNTDLDWLREHTRLLQRASEWDAAGRPANRLLSGTDIADGKEWAAGRPANAPEPTPLHLDFIRASEDEEQSRASAQRKLLEDRAAAQAERERALRDKEVADHKRGRLRVVSFAGLAVGLIALAVVALYAWSKKVEADAQAQTAFEAKASAERSRTEEQQARRLAEVAAKAADAEREKAIIQLLRGEARRQLEREDPVVAATIALDAHDRLLSIKRSELTREIPLVLHAALRGLREVRVFDAQAAVQHASFNADGTLIAAATRDGKIRIFEVATGTLKLTLEQKDAIFERVMFSRDGRRLTTRHRIKDKSFHAVWDVMTGNMLISAPVADGVWIRPDGTGFVIGTRRNNTYEYVSWDADRQSSVPLDGSGEVSPDGRRIVAPRAAGGIQLIDAVDGKVISEFLGDGVEFRSAVFDKSSRRVAIAWTDRQTVDVIDVEAGRHVKQLSLAMPIDRLLLSGDGHILVNLVERRRDDADEAVIESWGIDSGEHRPTALLDRRRILPGTSAGALIRDTIVALNHDGTRLLLENADGGLGLWSVPDGRQVSRLTDKRTRQHWGRFTEDGTFIVLIESAEVATVWQSGNGERVGRLIGHQNQISSFEASPDGLHILTSSTDGTARLWHVGPRTWVTVAPFPRKPVPKSEFPIVGLFSNPISRLQFNRGSSRLLASENRIRTLLWDVEKSRQIALFDFGYQTEDPVFNHRGDRFYVHHDRRTIGVYDSDSGGLIRVIQPELRSESEAERGLDQARLLLTPDDKFALVLAGSRIGTATPITEAEVWDLSEFRRISTLSEFEPSYYSGATFDPSGQRFAMLDKRRNAVVFDYGSWRRVKALGVSGGALIWSGDGKRLAVADGIVDAESGEFIIKRQKNDNCGDISDWSETTKRLVSFFGNDEPIICLHDAETGAFIRGVDGRHESVAHTRGIADARFVAEGRRFISASDDNSVRLWDSSNGELIAVLGEPAKRFFGREIRRLVVPYDVSDDGLHVVTGHDDRSVNVWDALTGTPLVFVTDHTTSIGSVAINRNGTYMASGSWDETVRVYPIVLDQSTLVARAIAAIPRCLNEAERKAVFLNEVIPDWCYEHNKFGVLPIRLGVNWVQPSGGSSQIPAKVARVMRGLPAEVAGIMAGDVVVAVNDTVVNSSVEANAAVAKLPPKAVARITVVRNGSREVILVTPRF